MPETLRTKWKNWREKRRQYQIERALYKAGGHGTGPFAMAERGSTNENLRRAGADLTEK